MLSALGSARIILWRATCDNPGATRTKAPVAPFCFSRDFRAHRHFPTTQLERSRRRRLMMLSVQHLDFVLIPTGNLDPRPLLSILSLLTSPSYRQSSVSTLDSWPSSLRILEASSCHCPVQFTVSQVSESVLRAHDNPKLHTYRDVDAIPDSLFFPLPSPPLFLSFFHTLSFSLTQTITHAHATPTQPTERQSSEPTLVMCPRIQLSA